MPHPHTCCLTEGGGSSAAVHGARRIVTVDRTRSSHSVSRRTTVTGLGTGVLLTALLGRGLGQAAAQESTPAITSGGEGVTAEFMGAGQPSTTPGMELTLRRIILAPGGGLAPHSHPGALVIYVESGTWGHTALGGTAQLTRAAVDGTPQPVEELEPGVETILTAGDVLFVENPRDHVRNAGEDDVVLLIAGLTAVGEPFTTFMDDMEMEATPTS